MNNNRSERHLREQINCISYSGERWPPVSNLRRRQQTIGLCVCGRRMWRRDSTYRWAFWASVLVCFSNTHPCHILFLHRGSIISARIIFSCLTYILPFWLGGKRLTLFESGQPNHSYAGSTHGLWAETLSIKCSINPSKCTDPGRTWSRAT